MNEQETLYLTMNVETGFNISMGAETIFPDGILGCCLVFNTYEAAEEYVGDRGIEIIPIQRKLT